MNSVGSVEVLVHLYMDIHFWVGKPESSDLNSKDIYYFTQKQNKKFWSKIASELVIQPFSVIIKNSSSQLFALPFLGYISPMVPRWPP